MERGLRVGHSTPNLFESKGGGAVGLKPFEISALVDIHQQTIFPLTVVLRADQRHPFVSWHRRLRECKGPPISIAL